MEVIGAAVIGGGAVGCAVAWELARSGVTDLFLFERLDGVGEAQSGRNSGVIHAGIYYAAGSVKAALCPEANGLMYEFCRRHGVPHAPVGKLVVAASADELPGLDAVCAQAEANGVPGARRLDRAGVRTLEPNVDVPAALHTPTTGIVDAAAYTRTLARLARGAGAQVVTGFDVVAVEPRGGVFEITGRRGGREESVAAEVVVNAAGLYAHTIARMVNPDWGFRPVPLRGEYYKFNRRRRTDIWLNGLNVYPVPQPLRLGDERLSMVGIHLTPTFGLGRDGRVAVGDTVTVGPEFGPAAGPEDYGGDRKPAGHFLEQAGRYFPNLRLEDLELDFTGIMVHLPGERDFIIRRDPRHGDCIHLLGIDSPGLTCSLAIARRVRGLLTGSNG
ncbi:MAG TPA: FAD-dependent oxidoreductase [Acidobacteriota bacterium]|mgnify:FL=1|nr:FAD-dependent oxidoreductase [Acidobacteriota bacterium]